MSCIDAGICYKTVSSPNWQNMKCVFDELTELKQWLHPDALFCEPYVESVLAVAPFRPMDATQFRIASISNGIKMSGPTGSLQVEVCAPWLLRIRCAPREDDKFAVPVTEEWGLINVPQSPGKWTRTESAREYGVASESLTFLLDKTTGNWRVRDADGQTKIECMSNGVRYSSEPAAYSGDSFLAAFRLDENEHIFGLGGRIAAPNRRATTADMFAVKVGSLSGDYGGFPIPFFISTSGYGVFLNNPWPHVYFDMGATRSDQWWVHGPGGAFDMFVVAGPAMPQIVSRFTQLVGRIPFPKRWWLGFWTSALAFSTADELERVADRLRREQYPCDALVIDGPWRGGPEFLQKYMQDGEYPTNDLNWHPDFGDGESMVRRLSELGFKTVLHQNSRSWLKATAEEGVKDGTLRCHGREVVVRFTYPEAEKFYYDALVPRHREQIGTWWLDHGDRVSGEIRPGIPSRNLFGALWARATQRAATDDGIGTQISLIRGAGIGGQTASLPWPGDTRFGVDYFVEDLWFCLNAGLCGFPITSADLGGFMPAKTPSPSHNTAYDIDNLARRLCQGIFILPSPRMHQCDSEPAKLPWNCPPIIQRLYRAMLRERYRLTPYFYSYAIHASRTGEPILRHLAYHHTHDPVAVQTHDACYIGEWMLVAPVLKKSQFERDVYLPEGDWYCWWTGQRHDGGKTIRVATPMFEPSGLPVFIKAGAIIPGQEDTACLPDEIPCPLTLDVFPAGSTRFLCHESETVSHEFACDQSAQATRLQLPNHTTKPREYIVRIHDRTVPSMIAVNDDPISSGDWVHDAAGEVLTLFVCVPPATRGLVTVR
jgi:alpha-D-xyloside xylohydrolase